MHAYIHACIHTCIHTCELNWIIVNLLAICFLIFFKYIYGLISSAWNETNCACSLAHVGRRWGYIVYDFGPIVLIELHRCFACMLWRMPWGKALARPTKQHPPTRPTNHHPTSSNFGNQLKQSRFPRTFQELRAPRSTAPVGGKRCRAFSCVSFRREHTGRWDRAGMPRHLGF